MMKKMIALVLIAMLLLAGCGTNDPPEATTEPTEAQPQYDWMAAESPIPVRRSGLLRAGLNKTPFDITNDGFYFISTATNASPNSYILYLDNNSDMVIKLCGRADCTHDTMVFSVPTAREKVP